MKRKVVLLLALFQFLVLNIHAYEFTDKFRDTVSIETCQQDDLPACETIFIRAFTQAYKDLTLQQLGVENLQLFLKEAFSDVYEDLLIGEQKLAVAKKGDKIVGFVGFKKTETPHQIYLTQLAVDPDYWQHGIGRHLVFSSLIYFEDTTSLVVIPRRLNTVAKNFYMSLGFQESSYMHPGYNPEKYVGYEWHKSD